MTTSFGEAYLMATTLADLWRVVVLGIVEGVTEFLPISSTGHLIIFSDLLDFEGSLGGTFEIFIQLGAVLAVVWYYRRDLWQQVQAAPRDRTVQRFWLNLAIAFVPAASIGFLVHDWIKEVLFNPVTVATTLIVGGILLLLIERRDHSAGTASLYDVTPKQALGIGLAQVFALIPGASRSATSIMGGLLCGLDRPTATNFSFYLAIPTLGLATVFDLLTSLDQIARGDALNLLVGTVVSFIVSLVVIGWLLRYIATNDFKFFGYYRVVFGLIVLAWFWLVR
jgi:undecaprenyl-diphosphatase